MFSKYLRSIFTLVICIVCLLFVGRNLLRSHATDNEVIAATERYVVPIRSSVIKKGLKNLGTITTSGDHFILALPAEHKDKIAAQLIMNEPEHYGATIKIDGGRILLSMKEGPRSTVLVPIPTLLALIDRGVLSINEEE